MSLGGKAWDIESPLMEAALKQRNQMLRTLSQQKSGRAWFIAASGERKARRWWRMLLRPEQVVIVATPESVCVDRIQAESTRPREQIQSVRKWWAAYRSSGSLPGEVVAESESS